MSAAKPYGCCPDCGYPFKSKNSTRCATEYPIKLSEDEWREAIGWIRNGSSEANLIADAIEAQLDERTKP